MRPLKGSPDFLSKAILMTAVKAVLETSTARHTLVVFDSCFSGGVFGARGEATLNALQYHALIEPSIEIITAGDAGQRTPAQSEFLPAFIAAARGGANYLHDGFVSEPELVVYLKQHVQRTTPEDGFLGLSTSGTFVFVPPGLSQKVMTTQGIPMARRPPVWR